MSKSKEKKAAKAKPSTKERTVSKKSKEKKSKAAPVVEAIEETTSTESTGAEPMAAEAAPTNGVPVVRQLPPPGTVVQKKGKDGSVRGEITILDATGKCEYRGKEYKSLSAAAMANIQDLALKTSAVDGWAWWGLKPKNAKVGNRPPRGANFGAKREKLVARLAKLQASAAKIEQEIADLNAAEQAQLAAQSPATDSEASA